MGRKENDKVMFRLQLCTPFHPEAIYSLSLSLSLSLTNTEREKESFEAFSDQPVQLEEI